MKVVREDEKFMVGGLNPGHFMMQEKFQLVVVTSTSDEEDLKKVVDDLPHQEDFHKFIIQ